MENKEKIRLFCKKNRTWEHVFLKWIKKYPDLDISRLESAFSLYLKYKNNLKKEVTIEFAKEIMNDEKYPDRLDIIESFTDKIEATVSQKERKSFIKSLKTRKYKRLFNSEIDEEIDQMIKNGLTKELLKNQFFNKLAVYTSSRELLKGLMSFKVANNNWSKSYYKNKIESLNAEILSENESSLMLQINDYKACNEIAPHAWCIARSRTTFEGYMRGGNHNVGPSLTFNRQYMFIDFGLSIEDNESIVGFTVDCLGDVKYSHLKDDKPTPEYFIKRFEFPKISNKELENMLQEITGNQNKFNFICMYNLKDRYEEFRNKSSVYVSKINDKVLNKIAQHNNKEIIEKILNDKHDSIDEESLIALFEGAIKGDNLELFNSLVNYRKQENITFSLESKKEMLYSVVAFDSLEIFRKVRSEFAILDSREQDHMLNTLVNKESINIIEEIYPTKSAKLKTKILNNVMSGGIYRSSFLLLEWLIKKDEIDNKIGSKILTIMANKKKESKTVELLLSKYEIAIKLNKIWCQNNLTENQYYKYKETRTG